MKILLTLALIVGVYGVAKAQSIKTERAIYPNRNTLVIGYDDSFLFVARHHGNQRDHGRNTEPGMFVHSKKHGQWRQILRISTKNGVFGSSNPTNKEDQKKMAMASVAWNFADLAKRDYADMPLRTSGSIAFPRDIVYVPDADQYKLGFMTDWDVPSAHTYLYFSRQELFNEFEKNTR